MTTTDGSTHLVNTETNNTYLPTTPKRKLNNSDNSSEDEDDIPLVLRKAYIESPKRPNNLSKQSEKRQKQTDVKRRILADLYPRAATDRRSPSRSPTPTPRKRQLFIQVDSDEEQSTNESMDGNLANSMDVSDHGVKEYETDMRSPSKVTAPVDQRTDNDRLSHLEVTESKGAINQLQEIMDEICQTFLEPDNDDDVELPMIKPTLPYRLQLCLRFMTLLSKLTTTEKTLSFLDSSQLGSVTKAIEQTVHAIIELDPIAVYVTTVRSLEVSSTTTSSPSSTSNEAQRQFLEILTCICDGLDIVSKLFGLISTGVLETKMIYEDLILTCLQMIKNQLDNTIYPLIEVNDCTDEITGAIGDAQLLLSFANSNSKAKHIMSRFLPLISRIIRRTHCLVQKDDTDEHAVIVLAYISMGSFFHDYNSAHTNQQFYCPLITPINDNKADSLKDKVTTITTTSEPIYTNITYYMSALNTYEHLKLVSLDMLRNVFGHFPRHRRWILEEILTSIGSLTTVDYRDNKRYRLLRNKSSHNTGDNNNDNSGNDKIHILSALFMQLIQCCDYSLDGSIQVQRTWLKKWELKVQKVEKDIVKRKELDQALTNRAAGVWKKGIESAVQNTTYFLEFLMSKCKARKKDSYSFMEYRTILECTLEDIVTVLNDPDWPAAELILQVFSKILVACIDSDTGDSYLRMMAIEWLGIIVDRIKTGYSHVAGVQGSYTPEWLYQLNKLIPHQLDEQGKAGYHLMDCCRMKLYQALLEESSDKNIAQFYLMSWGYSTTSIWRTFQERLLDDSEKNDNQNDTGISSDLAAFLQSSCHRYWFLGLDVDCAMPDMTRYDFPELNRDDLQMIAELLATRQSLFQNLNFFLLKIIGCLDKEVITFRVMALRALGQIAANSPEIWEEVHLHKAVIQRIYDVSPKVRDAAVELTASYLANQQVISRNLYEILSSRIMDTAPNVRKRIVKLLPDLYYKCDDEDIKIDIAAKLLQRMDDNEAPIRKLALKLTQQVLLLPFHQFDQDDSGNPFNNSTKIRKQKVTDWTNLITSTVAKLGGSASGRNMVLTRFVQETLDIADDKQRQRYERIFQWIVDCLFEKMLTFDETGKNREFIHCMATIHAFVKACPSLLNDTQIYTLLPYLSVSESDDWTIGKYVMVLYRDVLPRIKYRDLDFARMVEGVLLQALARCPNYVIEDAASCLCAVVANISHRYQILIKMLGSCLASLGQDQQHIINHRTIQRPTKTAKALMICGLLCQHFDFDEKRLNEGNKMGQLDAIYKGKINSYVFAKLQYFTGDILDNKIINKQIKLAAIKALGSLYSSHPTFMMTSQSTDLLDSIFVQDDIDMKVQILNVFQGFLTTEETRMQKRSEASGATLYNKVIDVETLLGNTEEFAELGANGSLMQRYLPSILKCTLGSTNQLRLSAFDVIETVINQGLAHPMMCMPAIVSAETSSDLPLRNKAYYLHIYIHNKFGSILYSQMDANLKAAFRYQELLCGKYNVKGYGRRTGENNSEDALLAVTYGVLKEKKNARMDFLNNMVKPFNIDMKEAKQSDILDINYLKFLADNLLTLPLTTSDELLFVLHCMDRIIVTAGGYTLSLVQQFKKEGVISTLSYMDDDDDDDDNGLDQDYAITAKAAIAMNILILTKDKLVSLYNIDEQQIQSYVLYGKNKSYDIIKDTEENGLVDWTELAFFRLNKLTSFTASDACLSLEKRMDECDTSSLIG